MVEVTRRVARPETALTYRTIGGILDIYVFFGPTPENVVQQYTEAVGRPVMVPYWALGFQLSKYGYDSLQVMRETVDRNYAQNIPHDVQYGDIDYMDRQIDFTYDTVNYRGLPDYVRQLQEERGMHFVIILDPCITVGEPAGTYPAYDIGNQMGVWIYENDGVTPALGKVWPPDNVHFPDYTNPATHQWWMDECVKFHDVIRYDGIWIDMNEPANFVSGSITGCDDNNINYPPFVPKIWGDVLQDKSVCPDYKQHLGNHYDLHNLYGWSQCEPTLRATRAANPGKRSLVLSRSTYTGAGKWAVHWLGDNFSKWSNLHYSIIGMMEFNIFGIPYVGADICGFIDNAEEQMCQRWMQLGAFYPFSRNHNGYGYRAQDPAAWGDEVARSSREALLIRYTLLPYLYTLFHYSHTRGDTVLRPLMHEFVDDEQTHSVDRSFLWGPAVLIAPVLEQDATDVDVYFPDARWYSYQNQGSEIPSSWRGTVSNVAAPMDFIPVYVRGGHVIPCQQPALTTTHSRRNPMELIVALDEQQSASGSMFWDDGDSLDTFEAGLYLMLQFTATNNQLESVVKHSGYTDPNDLYFSKVTIYGTNRRFGEIVILTNNGHVSEIRNISASSRTTNDRAAVIDNLRLSINEPFIISW